VAGGRGRSLGILAGPGVLADLDGIRTLAERIGVAVVNTWGAKGMVRWDSPYHAGTAGLQERDFALAGLADVDLLLTTGLDPDEVTTRPWEGRAEVVDIPPGRLATFPWEEPPRTPVRPALYTELSAVIMPLYEQEGSVPHRIRSVVAALEPGTVVVAEPGLLGYWVARAFPTTEPGSVRVPARNEPGIGAALASRLAAEGTSVHYVSDRPLHLPGVRVDVWDDLDLTIPDALLDVAGEVVAWR
jgi:thiamine pyrophosphate-dependent acetolactate synthase large subunit-like protein